MRLGGHLRQKRQRIVRQLPRQHLRAPIAELRRRERGRPFLRLPQSWPRTPSPVAPPDLSCRSLAAQQCFSRGQSRMQHRARGARGAAL
jgi:hypothetical protein